ncbi:hypothetical protein WR25_05789 isoform C [Diploscapter pachys]|uniref:Apple domain-containing protein n=1 Tax=Diploscapter pachys TaxID=2018661 RepID=A0A2A2K5D7_9BILA|nr:hypothetical protein WR25_05789 isoform B [Diploscapter pachys]PAV69138.1 hypothetical protein WR25_05789 isoform C [Diploscapter pachys]
MPRNSQTTMAATTWLWLLLLLLIAVTQSLSLSKCFDISKSRTLAVAPKKLIPKITLAACQVVCMANEAFYCRSITYIPKSATCLLYSTDHFQNKRVANPMSDYYHRTCFNFTINELKKKRVSPPKRSAIFRDAGCFKTEKGKVLIGIVDETLQEVASLKACQDACQMSKEKSDIVCKSAMFYEKEKECIIASQSKADAPALFIDDDKSTYIENVCWDGKAKISFSAPGISPTSSKFSPNDVIESGPSSHQKLTVASSAPNSSGAGNKVQKSAYGSDQAVAVETPVQKSAYGSDQAVAVETPVQTSAYGSDQAAVVETTVDYIFTTPTTEATTTTTTTMATTAVNAAVIDNYNTNVESKQAESYGRKLRDARIKSCFKYFVTF